MSSIDIQESAGPRRDHLGLSCFIFHLALGAFVLMGWLISSVAGLTFYLLLLPAMAAQWVVNEGACVINNVETWLRTGLWRDPEKGEDGRFLTMICEWLFAMRPDPAAVDRFSYSTVFLLWLLALGHLSWLSLS